MVVTGSPSNSLALITWEALDISRAGMTRPPVSIFLLELTTTSFSWVDSCMRMLTTVPLMGSV